MVSFQIPSKYESGFISLLQLSKENRQQLFDKISSLAENTPLKKIAENIDEDMGIDKKGINSIIDVLFSLMAAKDDANISVEVFVNGIIESINKSESIELKPDEYLDEQLKVFLSSDNKLYIRSKASFLTTERERLFLNARIVTDIRPIFDDIDTNEIEAGIIIHNLKIDFNQGNRTLTEYYAIDLEDLSKLKEQIIRAEAKERKLREVLNDSNIKFIDLNPKNP